MQNLNIRWMTLGLILGMAFTLTSCREKADPSDPAKFIPVQHNGRIKPLDSFARQTVEFITSKEKWHGQSPTATLLEALYDMESIQKKEWIRINNLELLAELGLAKDRHYFSYDEALLSLDKIESLARSAKVKRDKDLRPTKLEQDSEALYSRLVTVKHLMDGEDIKILPPVEGADWKSPYFSIDKKAVEFKNIVQLYGDRKTVLFEAAVSQWIRDITSIQGPSVGQKINWEVHYMDIRPFEISWVLYLLAFATLAWLKKIKPLKWLGICLAILAIAFHTYGLALRVMVLSRPPVSNMYESMVFMNWALIIFACVFAAIQRNLTFITAGSAVSALIMIYGNLLPIDTSLEVLVPVLRSNYWLTIHVLTIVASYGAFGLAMALGHRHLILDIRNKFSSKKSEENSAMLIYHVIQLGTLLLGVGTVLGGVWANESWGRFWGWDPKETWALITFLGYLVVVHLRHAKKITNFYMALSSVLGFLLVLMTWYGVNFVLGRGLHSYGSGSGGMIWVNYYLVLEILFMAYVIFTKQVINKTDKHRKKN